MKRKRLHHIAFTLCHMFCGDRLMADYTVLARLGSGDLHIDLKTGRVTFNGEAAQPLWIVSALEDFMGKELARHAIPWEALQRAAFFKGMIISALRKNSGFRP